MSAHLTITSRVIAVGVIRRTGLSAHIADCVIELDHGDITQESTRAIVNSVCGGNNLGGNWNMVGYNVLKYGWLMFPNL